MKKLITRIGLIAIAICFIQTISFSQQTISGVIVDSANDPIIGASVIIVGTTTGTISDIDGSYSLNIPEGATQVAISYIGYATQTLNVADGGFANIVMADDFNQLDEVVVTGLATTVKRKNLANSVAKIDAAELSEIAPAPTVESALYGKFKGAEIKQSSGAPGGGVSFRLRGTTSISGSSQPLVILDGVYLDNSSIPAGLNLVSQAAGGGSTSNQDNPSNRLADIDPSDLESIEILKGASAAAIYGSRAAGGVVIMTTKRGTAGETRVKVSQSLGVARQLRELGNREWTSERIAASDRFSTSAQALADFEENGNIDLEDQLYGNDGFLQNTRLSLTGGSEKTQFYFGGSYKDEEGIVEGTGYEKTSLRLNVNHKISKMFDLSVSSNYVNSSSDRGFFNNDNSGTTQGVSFSSTPSFANLERDSETGLFPDNPYGTSNFLETASDITNNENVNRFIGGGTLTSKILTTDNNSLKLILRAGGDFYNLNTTALFPNSLQFQSNGNGLNGVAVQGFTRNLNTNLSAFLVHSYYADNGMSFTTSAGVTQEDFDRNTILGEATNLIGAETNLDQSGSRNVTQFRVIQQDKGFFAQEEFNYNDIVLATIGFRADKSSNNGDVNELFFYPKANVAFNIDQLPFLKESTIITGLKVRAAYGESGNFANFGAKSTILGSSIVDASAGVLVPALLGNSEVGPERQKEFEVGADFNFLKRFNLDFTYYQKNVEDLLLNADLPSSSGFAAQVTNAAELENVGFEIGVSANILNTENTIWNTRFGFWTNNAEVTRLDVPAFTTGGFADFLGNQLVKEGFSPLTVIGVGPNPNITLNGDGEPTLQEYGSGEADFQLSWYNQFSWKNFDLSFVWHWKEGGENINLSTLLFDLSETTHDFDDTDLDPDGVLANGPYRLSLLGSSTEPYIQDAGYIRLREVGLYYNIPIKEGYGLRNVRLGFSGNNLVNIFDYDSYDPEVSNFGGGGLSTGVEVTPFPSSKRFDFHVQLEF